MCTMKVSGNSKAACENLKIEALISTVDQTDDAILERMNIQSDAVVVNQCGEFSWREYQKDGHRIRFLDCAERGVGLSRNTALMRAAGDVCLFSDDDLIYRDGYEEKLNKVFAAFPDADVVVFNIQSVGGIKTRYQILRPKRVRWFNFMRYGAARIAVRRDSIYRSHIFFSVLFGGGAQYSCGEDTIFLHDCLKAGMHIYAVPLTLADVDDSNSTWFRGYDDKFLADRGALHRAMFNRMACIQNLVYLLRHETVWRNYGSLRRAYRLMQQGSRDYLTLGGKKQSSEERLYARHNP